MRRPWTDVVEKGRIDDTKTAHMPGLLGAAMGRPVLVTPGDHKRGDRVGRFFLPSPVDKSVKLLVVANDAEDWGAVYDLDPAVGRQPWEHVSVSVRRGNEIVERTPHWSEMCWVKDQFWEPHETVLQFHPPEDVYISYHSWCLHLWKPLGVAIPVPPPALVGPATKKAAT